MSKTYLDLSAVGMRFKTEKGFFEALVDVNLKIAKGEFISLIGHSGCGNHQLHLQSQRGVDIWESRKPVSVVLSVLHPERYCGWQGR